MIFIITAILISLQDLINKKVSVILILLNVMFMPVSFYIRIVSLISLVICSYKDYKAEFIYILPLLYNLFILDKLIYPLIVGMILILLYREKVPLMPAIMISFL